MKFPMPIVILLFTEFKSDSLKLFFFVKPVGCTWNAIKRCGTGTSAVILSGGVHGLLAPGVVLVHVGFTLP